MAKYEKHFRGDFTQVLVLIDRAVMGYVTDMFQTLFMHFAVFNVADICVVCGGIGFCLYYLLLHGKEEKHDPPAADG